MPRKAGRPRADSDPRQREKHLECAGLFFTKPKWPVKRIARSCEIARCTVYLWLRLAMAQPEHAEALRRLARQTARGRRWLKEFDRLSA